MSVATQPRVRKIHPPVHGIAYWLVKPYVAAKGVEVGILEIRASNGYPTEYTATICRTHAGGVSGVRLTKPDRTMYHVDLETHSCDCPDHQYRGRECKHHKAVVAALQRLAAG
jgi:hypothetical protein